MRFGRVLVRIEFLCQENTKRSIRVTYCDCLRPFCDRITAFCMVVLFKAAMTHVPLFGRLRIHYAGLLASQ